MNSGRCSAAGRLRPMLNPMAGFWTNTRRTRSPMTGVTRPRGSQRSTASFTSWSATTTSGVSTNGTRRGRQSVIFFLPISMPRR